MSAFYNEMMFYKELLAEYKNHLAEIDNPNRDVSYFDTAEFEADLIIMMKMGLI